jgi:hypothetical protein
VTDAWSTADQASILIAIVYVLFGLWLDRRTRGADRVIERLANGLSPGPLLMIVADPVLQTLGLRFNLTELVLRQARLVLWWGAAVGATYSVRTVFKPSPAAP